MNLNKQAYFVNSRSLGPPKLMWSQVSVVVGNNEPQILTPHLGGAYMHTYIHTYREPINNRIMAWNSLNGLSDELNKKKWEWDMSKMMLTQNKLIIGGHTHKRIEFTNPQPRNNNIKSVIIPNKWWGVDWSSSSGSGVIKDSVSTRTKSEIVHLCTYHSAVGTGLHQYHITHRINHHHVQTLVEKRASIYLSIHPVET